MRRLRLTRIALCCYCTVNETWHTHTRERFHEGRMLMAGGSSERLHTGHRARLRRRFQQEGQVIFDEPRRLAAIRTEPTAADRR